MRFFDSNACFGAEVVNHEVVNHERFIVLEKVDTANDAASLLEYMDHAGIEKALVWHKTMLELDPTSGNKILMDEVAGMDRLIPSWTVLPCVTDREYAPEVFFESMKQNGVKALRAFPEANRYFLCATTMRRQLELMAELKIPLYVEPRNGFETVYGLLAEFPSLTVVLCNIGCWPSARYVYPLLENYKNFYFETGDFGMLRGFEEVCGYYGSERMLFGTAFPTNNMGGAMHALMRANITEEEKQNIAYDNLDRLLSEVVL